MSVSNRNSKGFMSALSIAGLLLAAVLSTGSQTQAQTRQSDPRQPSATPARPSAPAAAPAAQPSTVAQAAPAAAPRPAAVPQPVPEVFDKWSLRCYQDAKGAQSCRIETIVREQNNRPQLAVTVRPPQADNQPSIATVTPPWGILLARGIDMQIDAQPALRIGVRTCLPTGCLADFSLIDVMAAQWQKGTTLKLTMAAADGKPLTIEVPMAGYAKAYARLLEKSKQR
ncbi:MAG: invasion associated locus B family protein [Geminicoccaceae bacterium]